MLNIMKIAGFPGHISCTDNFNSSLAEFGVAPRETGQPSISFLIQRLKSATHSAQTSHGQDQEITFY
jgi:hypothetical protein